MPEQEFNEAFARRLQHYLIKFNMNQSQLAEKTGVGNTSAHNWCNGIKVPRMDKIDVMCELFHCRRSDLIEDKPEPPAYDASPRHPDHETLRIAQDILENKELHSLFDLIRDADSESLHALYTMALALKRK
ncbi:MAG: helix-turn-helix transcriptional regulator [Lachnospiraceae bacterium]|nr:helix-turn-helix transcriptional regulator [Lachnospiraceae bacterium]